MKIICVLYFFLESFSFFPLMSGHLMYWRNTTNFAFLTEFLLKFVKFSAFHFQLFTIVFSLIFKIVGDKARSVFEIYLNLT